MFREQYSNPVLWFSAYNEYSVLFPISYFSRRMSLVGSYVHEKAEGLEEYFAALGNM
jgi:hypothetical protein